jgi:ABC-type polysaccharide/polyol phosphate transport system ATPase subunit
VSLLSLKNIGLSYPVFHSDSNTGAHKQSRTGGIITRNRRKKLEVTALSDINIELKDGEKIGLLGHNGSGKTSLLRVMSGTVKPSLGYIRRVGKTLALLNPSVGLEMQMTGYENIDQLGLLYGISRRKLGALRDDVAEFSELADFLNLQVQTYSAGMQTRLAFGVATAFHPEILVADENIGAGDAAFIRKAQARMQQMMDQASILVLASHSMDTILQLCNRAIIMEHGRIIADGDVKDIVDLYRSQTDG